MTTGMDYRDAYKSAGLGRHIARESWPQGVRLFMPEPPRGQLWVKSDQPDIPYGVTDDDVRAIDWYIYE